MRKRILILFGLALIGLTGCTKKDTTNAILPTEIPTAIPTAAPEVTPTQGAEVTTAPDPVNTMTIADYYPMEADTQYQYDGEGNEFAAYTRSVDYIDEKNSRLQTRTQNGGSVTVRVIERKDGVLSVNYTANECYYRENFLDRTQENPEILLMEPLQVGTAWELSDGRSRKISALDVPVDTPFGSFQTLEVTTEEEKAVIKDYYAPGVGLVKSQYESKDSADGMKISSTLNKISKNTPFAQNIRIFHPDSEEKIRAENVDLYFQTGENAREKLEKLLLQKPSEDVLPLMSQGSKINDLSIDKDGVLTADFSEEFLTGMNLGSGYEQLVLQCLADTLGGYFGVSKVRITIDGKPYESGHISLDVLEVSQ